MRLPITLIELRDVVLRGLILQHRRLVLDEQIRRVAAMEAVLQVAVEQERRLASSTSICHVALPM